MNIFTRFNLPDLAQARRVLCIQPHYDDNDIGAGGTIALLHDRKAEIYYLTVTDDLVGVLDVDLPDEQARQQLRQEQIRAGEIIGVNWHTWLGYPDAGHYDYYPLRQQVIRYLRLLQPDFVLTCDPWLPYEAHQDHIKTGLAVAEALLLVNLPRLKVDPEVDRNFQPFDLQGVAFYYTQAPNATVDIAPVRERKHQALDCYQAQFTPQGLADLHQELDFAERLFGSAAGFEFGEPLKILRPGQLHISLNTLNS